MILATGYQTYLADCVHNLLSAHHPQQLITNLDYSVVTRYPKANKIFIQNISKLTHGISDPNLGLVAYRNACIINSIAKREIYRLTPQ